MRVSKLYVSKLYMCKLCAKLCVSKLYVSKLYVCKLCVSKCKFCAAATTAAAENRARHQSQPSAICATLAT